MSDDLLATDPHWAAVARFLEGRIGRGQRVTAPSPFARVTGPLALPDPAAVPDWAIVHKGQLGDYPGAALRRIAAETTPVYANDVFVVFARRPTFGLRSQRDSVHVTALLERLGALPAEAVETVASPPPVTAAAALPSAQPGAVPRATVPVPPRPALPPEAMALLRTAPAAVAGPVGTGLRARVVALLAERPGTRVVEIGVNGLTDALGATGPTGGEADAVVLRVADRAELDSGLEAARSVLTPAGCLLIAADNAESLGRRLAGAAGRGSPGGVSLPDLLGTLRAAGFRPGHAEGFSLDPWRASGDTPPPDQAPGTPGGDILDAAGTDAGPGHAALLLVLARRA